METIQLKDINLLDVGHTIQITGTIWSGNGVSFITQFPGKDEDYSNLKKLNMSLADWQAFLKQTDLLETQIITQDEHGKVTKAIVRKTQRQIDSYMQWAVFKRDNYSCRYCGRTGIPLTVDHIDLWENGGVTSEKNLLSACRRCNKDRGRTEYEVWIKSPTYLALSKNLPDNVVNENNDVIQMLPHLRSERVKNIRTR